MSNSSHLFNLMGITEQSFIDLGSGVASGVFKKDVRPDWNQCFKSIPKFLDLFTVLFTKMVSIDTSKLLDFGYWFTLIFGVYLNI